MKQLYCINVTCGTALNTSDEVASGLCTRCINLLQKRHAYAVVCWHCGNPTFIDDKPMERSRPIIKDKYIMSKSCTNCDPNSSNHDYMNNSKETSDLVLGENETIIPIKEGLKVSEPVKAPKHRKMDATVPSGEGSDILTKIQLEADEAAVKFLNSLEFTTDEENHG